LPGTDYKSAPSKQKAIGDRRQATGIEGGW
jgi:hypothetical protein